MRSVSILAASGALLVVAGPAHADVVTDWNGTAVALSRDNLVGKPNPATRAIAIAHLAAHDAVVAITKGYEPYHAELEPTLPASPEAAAAQAFHDTLLALFPDAAGELDDQLAADLAAVPDGDAKSNGVALGGEAAAVILALRAADGSETPGTYPGSTAIGSWRPTPLALQAASYPEWATLTPFALTSADQFRPAAPPALSGGAYAAAYTEVKLYGKKAGSARTAEQTKIANFWAQQTHLPFNAIARSLAKQRLLSTEESARLFALLNLALADSRIAAWDAKYHYGTWRPITAIQSIDPEPEGAGGAGGAPPGPGEYDDSNPDTVADAAWEPLLATPNHPSYVSGHSATGAAGAAVLAYYFGDATSFSVGSDTAVPEGDIRSFESFSDAAAENADSRVYAGIHFRFDNEAGLAVGTELGNYVVDNYLLEVPGGGGIGGAGEGGVGGEPGEGGAGAAVGDGGEPATPGGGGEPSSEGGTAATPSGGSGGNSGSGGKAGSGSPPSKSSDDSGCSCSTPKTGSNGALLMLAGLAAVLLRRRR